MFRNFNNPLGLSRQKKEIFKDNGRKIIHLIIFDKKKGRSV